MALPRIDLDQVFDRLRGGASAVTEVDKSAAELLDLLKDSHRIILKLEATVERLDTATREWEERIEAFNLSPERLDRLEEAMLNIENGVMAVEAALNALPKPLRERMARGAARIAAGEE